MAENVVVGSTVLTYDRAARMLSDYVQRYRGSIIYYDLAGDPARASVDSSDHITLADIGRLVLLNPRLSGDDAASLLATDADWTLVPADARLENANPDQRGELFDRMNKLQATFRGRGIGPAKVAKLLHLKRPWAYPVLDRYVFKTYAGVVTTSSGSGYWAAIRHDLVASGSTLRALRADLAARGGDLRLLQPLPALRLLDILGWCLGREAMAEKGGLRG